MVVLTTVLRYRVHCDNNVFIRKWKRKGTVVAVIHRLKGLFRIHQWRQWMRTYLYRLRTRWPCSKNAEWPSAAWTSLTSIWHAKISLSLSTFVAFLRVYSCERGSISSNYTSVCLYEILSTMHTVFLPSVNVFKSRLKTFLFSLIHIIIV